MNISNRFSKGRRDEADPRRVLGIPRLPRYLRRLERRAGGDAAAPSGEGGDRRLPRDRPRRGDPLAERHARERRLRGRQGSLLCREFRGGDRARRGIHQGLYPESQHERCLGAGAPHARVPRLQGRAAARLRQGPGAPGGRAARLGVGPGRAGARPLARRAHPLSPPLPDRRAGPRSRRPRDGGHARDGGGRLVVEEPARPRRAQAGWGRDDRLGPGTRSRDQALSGAARALPRFSARAGGALAGDRDARGDAAVRNLRRAPLLSTLALLLALSPGIASAKVLVPMDGTQTDHLRAYGLMYWALARGLHGEWLLNYRGGSFLLPDDPGVASEAVIRGVSVQSIPESAVAQIYAEIADNNMEVMKLETAPRIAVHVPPSAPPGDDAGQLALDHAPTPDTKIWDAD